VRQRSELQRVLIRVLVWACLAIVAAAILMLVVWILPSVLTEDPHISSPAEQQKAVTDTRTGLVALLVVIGAVGGLAYTARSYGLSRAGQITDRYSKAIEQLGAASLDVRMGGIYALEQLATDSDRKRDMDTIVEVLSAFVRVHSDPAYRWRSHLDLHGQT
jgi:hypothetical protein